MNVLFLSITKFLYSKKEKKKKKLALAMLNRNRICWKRPTTSWLKVKA